MKMRRLGLVVAALVAGVVTAGTRSLAAQDAAAASTILGRAHTATFDRTAIFEECSELLAARPQTRWIRSLLGMLDDLREYARDPRREIDGLRTALGRPGVDGFVRHELRRALAFRLLERGEIAAAKEVVAGDGAVERWLLSEPPALEYGNVHDLALAPEREPMESERVRWQPLECAPVTRDLDPTRIVELRGICVYLTTFVKAPADLDAVLTHSRVYGSCKIWVSGALVRDVDRGRARAARHGMTSVRLAAGWNRVLVKLSVALPETGWCSFGLRISDPRGEAIGGLEFSNDEKSARPHAPALATAAATPATWALPADPQTATGELGRDELLVHALALEADGFAPEAWEILRTLEGDADPLTAHCVARFIDRYELLPDGSRHDRAKRLWEGILARDPAFVRAHLSLARLLKSQDKSEEALRLLDAHAAAHPPCLAVAEARVDILEDEEWEGDATAARAALLRTWRDAPLAVSAEVSRYADLHRYIPATALAARRDERVGGIWATHLRLRSAESQGDAAAAAAEVATLVAATLDEVERLYLRARGAEVEWRAGRTGALDEALTHLRAAAALRPFEARPLNHIAELLTEGGRDDEARAARVESLRRVPSQHELREMLGVGRAEREALIAEHTLDAAKVIDEAKDALAKDYAKASSVLLIDQVVTIVEPDGYVEREVHQLVAIRDKNGVKDWGEIEVAGDIVTLHTILPDGTKLEPVGGDGRFTMPGLVPGAFVERKSRDRAWRRPDDERDAGGFFFQDAKERGGSPYHLTRWIVSVPKGARLELAGRSFGPVPAPVERDGRLVYVCERRGVPRIEAEPAMPATGEIVPRLRLRVPAELDRERWEAVNAQLLAEAGGFEIPTPSIARLAAELCEGATDARAKANAIYDAVMTKVEDGEAQAPDLVWAEKSGQRLPLMVALLRQAGLECRVAWCMDLPDRTFEIDWSEVGRAAFTAPLLYVPIEDGAVLWLQPNVRWLPFGHVLSQFEGCWAFVSGRSAGALVKVPSPAGGVRRLSSTRLQVSMTSDGARVQARWVFDDDLSVVLKRMLASADATARRQFVTQLAAANLQGVSPRLESFELLHAADLEHALEVTADLRIDRPVTKARRGRVASLRGLIVPNQVMTLLGGKTERSYPFVLTQAARGLLTVEIDPGVDAAFETLPADVHFMHAAGQYRQTYSLRGRVLVMERTFELGPCRIPVNAYADLVKFCRAIDDNDAVRVPVTELDRTRGR
jgi:hypothetical protein